MSGRKLLAEKRGASRTVKDYVKTFVGVKLKNLGRFSVSRLKSTA